MTPQELCHREKPKHQKNIYLCTKIVFYFNRDNAKFFINLFNNFMYCYYVFIILIIYILINILTFLRVWRDRLRSFAALAKSAFGCEIHVATYNHL